MKSVFLAAVSGLAMIGAAHAADEGFYQGKNVALYIGYSSGGGYDVYARTLARHMGRHIPGDPTIVPQNMPGAGSLRLANWLYNAAPKDGSVFGALGRGIAFEPILEGKGADFDASKFAWIGSANNEVSVCVAWEGTGVTSLKDLRTKELVVGGTGGSADTDQFPRLLNNLLGTKMKLVSGYPGGNEINLAMERGEVQGRCGWSWSSVVSTRPDWLKEKKISVLTQIALKKHPDLPDVPLAVDQAENKEDRQIMRMILARQSMGRPYVAPPGVPEGRVKILREAFMATMKDPKFLEETKKAQMEIDPVSGEEVQELVREAYEAPKTLIERAKKAVAE